MSYDELFKKLYVESPIKIIANADAIKEMVNKSRKGKSTSETLFGSRFNEGKIPNKLEPTTEETRKQLLESYGKYIKCAKDYYVKANIVPTPEDLFQSALNEMAKEGKTTPNEKIIKALAEECKFELTNQKMYDEAIKVFKVNTKKNEGKIPDAMTPTDEKTRKELLEDETGNANPTLDGTALNAGNPLQSNPNEVASGVATNFQSITGISPEELVNGQELNDQTVADAFSKIVDYLKSKYPDLAQESALEEFQGALDGALKSQYQDSFQNIPECFSGDRGKVLRENFGVPGTSSQGSVEGYTIIARSISDQPTAQQIAQQKGGKFVTDADDPKKWMVVLEESFGITEGRAHYNAVAKILKGVSDKELRNKLGDQFSDVLAKDNPGFKHSKFKDYLNAEGEGVSEIDENEMPVDTAKEDPQSTVDPDACSDCNGNMDECHCGKAKGITKEKIKEAKEPIAADISALKNTMGNLYNYYLADDFDQAIEYGTLIVKQGQDVVQNLERAKATKGAVDQIKSQRGGASASTLHQKVEGEVPGEDTDDLQVLPPSGVQAPGKQFSESVLDEKDGELKFKIKVKAKIPIEGEDIKAKPTSDKEEAGEDKGKTKERVAKDAKKAAKVAEKGSSVEVDEAYNTIEKPAPYKVGDDIAYNGGNTLHKGKHGTVSKIDYNTTDVKFKDGKTFRTGEGNSLKKVDYDVVKESLTEAKVGDKVIYNGNGAQGYQGKSAEVIGMSPDGAFAILKFEDGAVYKGAKVEKLQPATSPVADPVKDKVQAQRTGANDAKPFDQKTDDDVFDLQKQYALPPKVRESKEALEHYLAALKAEKLSENVLIAAGQKAAIALCERGLKEGFAIGISSPQAVGAIGAPEVKNTEEIEKDAKKDDRTKENANVVQGNDGLKTEGKVPSTLTPTDEKTRKELLEITELAERCFLAIKLSEKAPETLTEKEKKFIAETNAITLDEARKTKVKNAYRKMFRGAVVKSNGRNL